MLTIVWNRGKAQEAIIDDVSYNFPAQTILPLMANNTFEFSNAEDLIVWQFNREFYCIVDHDKEVSCAGFLFYGNRELLFIELDHTYQKKLDGLVQIFEDEFEESDNIQGEMLRMLLKRLIILTTRIGKQQFIPDDIVDTESDLIRSFNMLVENNFREMHQVQDYAELLNKSPKSLTNLFARYNNMPPLQVIKNRIVIESKRLLRFSDKSSKEISFELGFEDPASFSRFFKNQVGISPTAFQKQYL
ncbi:AraC family transcriptional regulator [Portibacter lacus]|uniref:AraC family transcriptional regulator n=1 Tax=Portibacter lacus TaxID=1099794 RepID=A0AA37WEA6_9BACT|nr:AraC family transcriptional regulator [Portibacter lacus]